MQLLGQVQDTGKWLLRLDDGSILQYDTQMEALTGMSKLATAQAIIACVKSLAPAADSAADLRQEYFDVGGFVNEAQTEFLDPSLEALGITPGAFLGCVNLLEQIDKLMSNQAVQQNTWRSILNQVRRAQV